MGGFSLWHWLIVLVIVLLVFGTKRLKNVGQDLGEAIRGFKKGMDGEEAKPGDETASAPTDAAPTPTASPRADEDDHNPPAAR